MHDHAAAIDEIKGLSVNTRNALSHILRNGLMAIIAVNRRNNPDIEEAVGRMERAIKEVGL